MGATLQGVRMDATIPASEALNALTNRSGVLRPASIIMTSQNAPTAGLPAQAASEQNLRSSADAVEFIHNTLKAWLASLHLLAENKPRDVANRALVSGMDDVIVFCAAASTHEDYSRILIEQLLSNADRRGDESDQRAIWILAMRCDAAAPVLPASLREELAGLSDLLFPPRNFGEASQLAALGDMAISHLRWSKALPDELLAPITRCLRLIDSPAGLEALQAYKSLSDPAALEELAQVFDPLTLPAVRRATRDVNLWSITTESVKSHIRDLQAISDIGEATNLWLSNSAITSLEPIKELSKLEILDISGTNVSILGPLSGLSQLIQLVITNAPVNNLDALSSLHKLRLLSIDGKQLEQLKTLSTRFHLELLSLAGSAVVTLQALDGMAQLKGLSLHGTNLDTLEQLSLVPNLSSLTVSGQPIPDMTPVAHLHDLSELSIADSKIESLAALKALPRLERLSLFFTRVQNSASLGMLEAIKELSLFETGLDDITPLAGLKDLRTLSILGRARISIEPIIGLPSLLTLAIGKKTVSSREIKHFLAAVPGREVHRF